MRIFFETLHKEDWIIQNWFVYTFKLPNFLIAKKYWNDLFVYCCFKNITLVWTSQSTGNSSWFNKESLYYPGKVLSEQVPHINSHSERFRIFWLKVLVNVSERGCTCWKYLGLYWYELLRNVRIASLQSTELDHKHSKNPSTSLMDYSDS